MSGRVAIFAQRQDRDPCLVGRRSSCETTQNIGNGRQCRIRASGPVEQQLAKLDAESHVMLNERCEVQRKLVELLYRQRDELRGCNLFDAG